jgi:hypothetical protein
VNNGQAILIGTQEFVTEFRNRPRNGIVVVAPGGEPLGAVSYREIRIQPGWAERCGPERASMIREWVREDILPILIPDAEDKGEKKLRDAGLWHSAES